MEYRFTQMSVPCFFFIKNGKVVSSAIGGMNRENLSAKIDSLLNV